MSVLYHPDKTNLVVDSLSQMTMSSVSHLDEAKNNLSREVHRLARLGMRFKSSSYGDVVVHHKSDSSLVVEEKSKQHLDLALIELKKLCSWQDE